MDPQQSGPERAAAGIFVENLERPWTVRPYPAGGHQPHIKYSRVAFLLYLESIWKLRALRCAIAGLETIASRKSPPAQLQGEQHMARGDKQGFDNGDSGPFPPGKHEARLPGEPTPENRCDDPVRSSRHGPGP